jgi:DinB superfamily
MSNQSAVETYGKKLSSEEVTSAVSHLRETARRVVEAVEKLSEAQWQFKLRPECWSAGENLEHLAIVEEFFLRNVAGEFGRAPLAARPGEPEQADAAIWAKALDRSVQFKSPERITPTGRLSRDNAVRWLEDCRARTIQFLQTTPDLRDHALHHPAVGPLDGYQWVLLIAAHTERHRLQILEVQASPEFPAR